MTLDSLINNSGAYYLKLVRIRNLDNNVDKFTSNYELFTLIVSEGGLIPINTIYSLTPIPHFLSIYLSSYLYKYRARALVDGEEISIKS